MSSVTQQSYPLLYAVNPASRNRAVSHLELLGSPLLPCILKRTDTSLNGAPDALNLILQISRRYSRLAGNLTSFGRTAFYAAICDVCQICKRFFTGFRSEQDANCCSDQSSNAKCCYRLHVNAPPIFRNRYR